jgi:excisionase family DNA binding protein
MTDDAGPPAAMQAGPQGPAARSEPTKPREIPSDLVDEVALADRLGVSRSTLQSWRYSGRGPRYIKVGRLIRYRNADIDAYLHVNSRGEPG